MPPVTLVLAVQLPAESANIITLMPFGRSVGDRKRIPSVRRAMMAHWSRSCFGKAVGINYFDAFVW